MPRKSSLLKLNRETVRELSERDLGAAGGQQPQPTPPAYVITHSPGTVCAVASAVLSCPPVACF
ncbi:MAG TPA: hypothetical protein VG245_09305 [Candidatus Dormibacteraeota bacterium]|jgi:hypothetical protein|nr:hypothetical protein [Candidatus Dormibacteraeota bacterium]